MLLRLLRVCEQGKVYFGPTGMGHEWEHQGAGTRDVVLKEWIRSYQNERVLYTAHPHSNTNKARLPTFSCLCNNVCPQKNQGNGSAVFQSGILNLEMLLKQAAVFAAPLGTPNRLQVAVAFHALDEATKLFQRHSGLLAEVRATLCNRVVALCGCGVCNARVLAKQPGGESTEISSVLG